MKRLILIAATAVAVSAGAFGSAQALPALNTSPAASAGALVQQATFWRWRGWDNDRRYYHRRHWRRDRY